MQSSGILIYENKLPVYSPVNVSVQGLMPASLLEVPKSEIFSTPLYVFMSTLSPCGRKILLRTVSPSGQRQIILRLSVNTLLCHPSVYKLGKQNECTAVYNVSEKFKCRGLTDVDNYKTNM